MPPSSRQSLDVCLEADSDSPYLRMRARTARSDRTEDLVWFILLGMPGILISFDRMTFFIEQVP